MGKAPGSSTQLGISEQSAREFKRVAEQEEQAATAAWNDGSYDSAASHFERAANTLRKYAVHVQSAAQAQVIKRKAAKLLDLCQQLRALTTDGKPDESKARRLRTESQSELAVINADIEAAGAPRESAASNRQRKAETVPIVPAPPALGKSDAAPAKEVAAPQPKTELGLIAQVKDEAPAEPASKDDLPARTESAAAPLDEGSGTPSQPQLRLLASNARVAEAPRKAETSEQKTAPALKRVEDAPQSAEPLAPKLRGLKTQRIEQLHSALLKCDFAHAATAFDALADDFSVMSGGDTQKEIEFVLASVFAREIANLLRRAPEQQGQSAMELARMAYGEGNFKGAAEQFKKAALDLLATAQDGKSDKEIAQTEMRASRLLTFSSRLRAPE